MTPAERAEKIYEIIFGAFASDKDVRLPVEIRDITKLIEEAERDWARMYMEDIAKAVKNARDEGFAAAREKAAKIAIAEAQKCGEAAKGRDDKEVDALQIEWEMGHKISKRIRAMEADK